MPELRAQQRAQQERSSLDAQAHMCWRGAWAFASAVPLRTRLSLQNSASAADETQWLVFLLHHTALVDSLGGQAAQIQMRFQSIKFYFQVSIASSFDGLSFGYLKACLRRHIDGAPVRPNCFSCAQAVCVAGRTVYNALQWPRFGAERARPLLVHCFGNQTRDSTS